MRSETKKRALAVLIAFSHLFTWSVFTLVCLAIVFGFPGLLLVENFVPELVWQAKIRGHVTDERGPVAGARVDAEYFGDRSAGVIPGSRSPAITNENGEFELVTVPGAVTLFARREGQGISAPLDLEPKDDEELAGIELRIDPGGRITGECVGADGAPRSGRWIAIEQAAYGHWREEDRIANMRTNANGEFECDGVPEGEIRVMLDEEGSPGPWYPFVQEQVVTVRRAESTHVRFEIPLHPWER